MSLAIPYVLDAAAEARPRAVLAIAARNITTRDLNRLTQARADRYLSDGCQPGDSIPFLMDTLSGVIDALAGARVGLVLSDSATTPGAGTDRPRPADRHVAESRLWSESALANIAGDIITHGEVLGTARQHRERLPASLEPLLQAIRAIDQATSMSRDSAHLLSLREAPPLVLPIRCRKDDP